MLDPALLRGQLDTVTERLRSRGYDLPRAQIEALEARRKTVQMQTQELQNQRNTRSKAIGMAKAKGRKKATKKKAAKKKGGKKKGGKRGGGT